MTEKFDSLLKSIEDKIKDAPVVPPPSKESDPAPSLEFPRNSGIPKRYLSPGWVPNAKEEWRCPYTKARKVVSESGILSLVGGRGSGKTRLAIEVARRISAKGTRYVTAMDIFLRLQSCYRKNSEETELGILKELSKTSILIVDEVQERGNTEWEDRILTHLVDKRYGAMVPTIMIANLKPVELRDRLGPSIIDRMHEGGGLLEIAGTSHRRKSHGSN